MRNAWGSFILPFLLLAPALAQGPEDVPRNPEPFSNPKEATAVRTRSGAPGRVDAELSLAYADHTIGGQPVRLRSYNGQLTGPTLRVRPGDVLRVLFRNGLPCPPGRDCGVKPSCGGAAHAHHAGAPEPSIFNTTNLHTHGLHVSPNCPADNVLMQIEPGQSFPFEFKIPEDHPAGTFWYHPHVHGSTAIQVSSGAAGALIVEGPFDQALGVPRDREEILIFQQIPYYCGANPNDSYCAPGEVGKIEDFKVFGPGNWPRSRRFTTVNGKVQPVLTLRPGEVRRWRMIHGGVREGLSLEIVPLAGTDKPLFREVALDGLPTGGIEAKPVIDLQPGYRSDALLKIERAGTYLLIDNETPPENSLLLEPEPRKVLAMIRVTGQPCTAGDPSCTWDFPAPEKLEKFRLPTLWAVDGSSPQEVEFDIQGPPDARRFLINGRGYDPGSKRVLKLNRADEWTLTSQRANHPFHIHVNPFELIEKRADGTTRRLWKDTILVRPGQTVRFRTRYEDFTGKFVLHCHILDHEDQGMMELVEIVP